MISARDAKRAATTAPKENRERALSQVIKLQTNKATQAIEGAVNSGKKNTYFFLDSEWNHAWGRVGVHAVGLNSDQENEVVRDANKAVCKELRKNGYKVEVGRRTKDSSLITIDVSFGKATRRKK